LISIAIGDPLPPIRVFFEPATGVRGRKAGVGRRPVRFGFEDSESVEIGLLRVITDDEGRFELRGLPPHSVLIEMDTGERIQLPGANVMHEIELD